MTNYTLDSEKALIGVLENLLKKDIVKGVVVQTKGNSGTFHSLITDPSLLSNAAPFAPHFSSNIARFLQYNGLDKVAVIARPCEARAINELAKLKQINKDNLILISIDCLGTYDPKDEAGDEPLTEAKVKELEKKKKFVRNACRVCTDFTVPEVDIEVQSIGVGKGYILATENADLVEGLKEGKEASGRADAVAKILATHEESKAEMVKGAADSLSSMDKLVEMLKFCIRCDNCRDVCPVCYCKVCYFQTPIGITSTDQLLSQAQIKGQVRVPADILFYHFTRNMHVAASCVECGACEEGCPQEIPLLSVWKLISGDVQGLFDYRSGMKTEEPLPLTIFEESELEEK